MGSLLIWIVVGLVVLAVLGFLLVSYSLSPRQQVTRVELIKAPLAEVWEAVSNLPSQAYWRRGLRSIQMLDDDDGLRWVEHPEKGLPVTLRKLKEKPQQELVLAMINAEGHYTRQVRFSNVPGGTRLTFTDILETPSPFNRIKARTNGGLDSRLDQFIMQLRQKFGMSV